MRLLVTGHHGYLGSIMVPMLHDAGYDVVGLDTYFYRGCDFGDHSAGDVARVDDIRDVEERALAGFDAVVHLAALSNDPTGDLNPRLTSEINLEATMRLARAAKEAGVARFVFASSCSMYGAGGEEAVDEDAPLRPLTPYAETKVRAEEALRELADGGFAPVFMRNATVFGVSPRLRLDVVLNNLVAWAHTTGRIRLLSDGSPWRPLVHVSDVARAAIALLEAPIEAVRNEAYNIGATGENHRIRDLAELVRERLPSCEVEFAHGASPDARSYRVDFRKFGSAFPTHALGITAARGIDELAEAYQRVGLTLEIFQGRRYIRLAQIKHLLDAHMVGSDLRWSSGAA